jgi:hypothetical protein
MGGACRGAELPSNSRCSWRLPPSRRPRGTRRTGPPGGRVRALLMPALDLGGRMKIRALSLLLFMVVILSPDWILAGDYQPRTFVGLGVGGSSLGASVDVHITQRYDKIVASVRYLHAERELWSLFPNPAEGSYKFSDLGILVGYSFEGQETLLTIEAGLSLTMGERSHRGRETLLGPEIEYEAIENVIGYLLGSQLYVRITEHFGIGSYPYMNFNEHKNYGGINFEIVMGQL